MDYRHKEALRKSRIFLVENIIFHDIVDHIIDQDIFSDGMLERIRAGEGNIECVRRLLDYLNRRPDDCFDKFLFALCKAGHNHCAQRVTEEYVRSGPTQISDKQSLTTSEFPSPESLPHSSSFPAASTSPVSSLIPFSAFPLNHVQNGQLQAENSMQNRSPNYSRVVFPVPGSEVSSSFGFPERQFTGMSIQSLNEISSKPQYPVQESCAGVTVSSGINNTSQESVNSIELFPVRPFSRTASDHEYYFNKDRFYRMDSTPRGYVLIINNEKFDHMSDRPGSQRDQQKLHHLFHHLGFKITHEMNKTAKEMLSLMRAFAQYGELKFVDALAVIILSHGGQQGIIYGKDGSHTDNHYRNIIKEEDIQKVFSARNCPVMASKPKLFIIQACRGRNEDTADGVGGEMKPMNISFANMNLEADSSSARTADMADMCLIHSTVQGYVSYRHPQNGSPFVEDFTEVFRNKASTESLTDMMTEVTHRLSRRSLQEDLRTVPSYTNTLTKKWFFNPPSSDHFPSSERSSFA